MKPFPLVMLFLIGSLCLIPVARGDATLFQQSKIMVPDARLSDAEEMLQQWLALHGEDREARFLLARIYAWQGKRAQALVEYRNLLRVDPGNRDYREGHALAMGNGADDGRVKAPVE